MRLGSRRWGWIALAFCLVAGLAWALAGATAPAPTSWAAEAQAVLTAAADAAPRKEADKADTKADKPAGKTRQTPEEALRAQGAGAVLVDIRPEANREAEGRIPGAVVIERTVLEWRLDPACEARLPLASYDLHVVVVCNEGYSSSLAAATLQQLGIHRATDLVGGFRAWQAAGLPVE